MNVNSSLDNFQVKQVQTNITRNSHLIVAPFMHLHFLCIMSLFSTQVAHLPQERKEALLERLNSYLTENRLTRFESVLSNRTRHFAVAVEDVYQEHNAGALVRTCDCFGVQDMYIMEHHNKYKVDRTISKGAVKWVDQHRFRRNPHEDCIDTLKAKGYKIVATTPHTDDTDLPDLDISEPTAFIFGTEKEGITQKIIDRADAFVKIPMVGFTESFNVSVAAALVLQDTTTRLRRSNIDWQLKPEEKLDLQLDWALKTIVKAKAVLIKEMGDLGLEVTI